MTVYCLLALEWGELLTLSDRKQKIHDVTDDDDLLRGWITVSLFHYQ